MNPRVGVGFRQIEDSFRAGQEAARAAMEQGRLSRCDLVLLFSTCQHQPQALVDGVRSVVGPQARLIGGGAVGAFTNDEMGYGGFEVAVACLSISADQFNLFRADGLADHEFEVGETLGAMLAAAGADAAELPKVLFYDSINLLSGRTRLNMAMPLLAGMRKSIPHLQNLIGAGLVGDMAGDPTFQWFDSDVCRQSALALTFSPRIGAHTVILRGASPVGGYHVVTRAEGAVVQEIDGRPAIEVISELLGGAKDPSEFAFYVMLGVNEGDPWAPYREDHYSNYLCLRADVKRGHLVMFEPGMVTGTRFQLMSRSHDFAYIGRKVEELFDRLGDERPFFALYLNCAGRAGAYAGIEDEDVRFVQRAINGRAPLLGLYSGVEIGPVRGEVRAMDWTGVLCLFTLRDF
jgi:hypothetical protein